MTNAPPADRGPDPVELVRRLDVPGGDSRAADSLHPDTAACGHFNIRIARDGTWFYHGSPIARKPLVKLFASVLRRDETGCYWLVTPAERGLVDVDDAPFTAVALTASGAGRTQRLLFRTNLDDEIVAGPGNPIRVAEHPDTGEPSPYLHVRGGLEALILRPVFYQLVELGVSEVLDGVEAFGVWSEQTFFRLGTLR